MKPFATLIVLVAVACTLGCDDAAVQEAGTVSGPPLKVVLTDVMPRKSTGEPLLFGLRLENQSDRAIAVAELDNVLLGTIGPDGERIRWLDSVMDYDDVPVEDWDGTVLEPGESLSTNEHGPLHFNEPGEYTLWVTYHGPGFQDGLPSNQLTFTVK